LLNFQYLSNAKKSLAEKDKSRSYEVSLSVKEVALSVSSPFSSLPSMEWKTLDLVSRKQETHKKNSY